MSKQLTLLRKDLRTVYRDGLLLVILFIPLVAAVALRLLLHLAMSLWPPLPTELPLLVAPLVAFLPAYMTGMIGGLTLVAERESGAALSLRVMPLSVRERLAYQCGLPSASAAVLAPLCLAIYGSQPPSWGATLFASACLAPTAGLLAFFLGGLARNRIQAMAAAKLLGVLMLTPALVFLLPAMPGQLAVGWSPWYWGYVSLVDVLSESGAVSLALGNWPGHGTFVTALLALATTLLWTWLLANTYHRTTSKD